MSIFKDKSIEQLMDECFNRGYRKAKKELERHGKWTVDENHIEEVYTNPVICSACGQDMTLGWGEFTPYCPNCGAKMDKE